MTATHKKLHIAKQFYALAATELVGLVLIGDSRNDWRKWRGPGHVFRHFNVKHAALIQQGGVTLNDGSEDGLGDFPIALTGIPTTKQPAGYTLANSGFVNRYPGRLSEFWVTGATNNPHFGRFNIVYSTAGFDMDSSAAGGTGGQFAAGDPAQGRNVQRIETFFVVDDRVGIWLGGGIDFGFSASESNGGTTTFSALTQASDPNGELRKITLTPTPATGTNIRVRQRHTNAAPATGRGHILAATKIVFGTSGLVYDNWAIAGQSISDYLEQDPVGSSQSNSDWKFLTTKAVEWTSNVIAASKYYVIIELGQNQSTATGYEEWNGVNTGNYKRNMEWLIRRVVEIMTSAGATHLWIELRAPWRGSGDDFNRLDKCAQDLQTIADTYAKTGILREIVYYDQQHALEDAGHCSDTGTVLNAGLREDASHQNWDGMLALGSTYWNAVQAATAPTAKSVGASMSLGMGLGLGAFTTGVSGAGGGGIIA